MPQIDAELSDFRGCGFYAVIDFVSSYWQLLLALACQEYHSIITPFGVYTPTRTLQGAVNSAVNFQSRVEPCFAHMQDKVKGWLDDFILLIKSKEQHLEALEMFFQVCIEKNLKISAKRQYILQKKCGGVVELSIRTGPDLIQGTLRASKVRANLKLLMNSPNSFIVCNG